MKALWVSVEFCGLWVFWVWLGGERRGGGSGGGEKGRWWIFSRGGLCIQIPRGGCFLDFLGLLGFTVGESFGLVLP